MKLLRRLKKEKAITPPPWLIDNLAYCNIHGSELYGCATDTSDKDIYGICLPPKSYLFPHIDGYIAGFGSSPSFESWIQHHIKDSSSKKTYDFQIFNITKFLMLALQGNPNVIECLWASPDCILFQTEGFQPILDNKKEFLTKQCIPRYRGYAYSQFHKLKNKEPEGKRKENFDKFGYCPKFTYHLFRLMTYAEQILENRYLDLRRDRELFKSVKRGDLSLQDIENWFSNAKTRLDKLEEKSTLPLKPNVPKIKDLLINLIENHYGSIDSYIQKSDSEAKKKLEDIKQILL